MRPVGIGCFLLVVAALGPWLPIARRVPAFSSTTSKQQAAGLPPIASRSSLTAQVAQFDNAYARILQASKTGRFSRYREQLHSFLTKAKALKEHAQADYQRELENSNDPQVPSLELRMLVDDVSEVSRTFDSRPETRSRRKLEQQTRLWLSRLEIGLEQDKAILHFSHKPSGRQSRGQNSMSNPDYLYSEAKVSLRRAQRQLAAGDVLGAWLSVAECDMLVGNLAMRLPPSTVL
jgi:hypothetical protein